MTTIHVAITGADSNPGTLEQPKLSIQAAAEVAMPGDNVVVHEGTYREWVRPVRGGLSDQRRITYETAPGEHVLITGSEPVSGWIRQNVEVTVGEVWQVTVPNSLFGDFNPFSSKIWGDWLVPDPYGQGLEPTLGEVYLNGRSLRQVRSLDEVAAPPLISQVTDVWTRTEQLMEDPQWTQAVWFAEVGQSETVLTANFPDGVDPNTEQTEINVRPAVFYPTKHHLDWITIRGFELSNAASPWAPPTADQPGLIGPNWAKGWIIENCDIHDAKCSAVSLGKEASTGDNFASTRRDKPGYQYQLEAVFAALEQGWSKERIGSHIVRNNHIYNSGQNGIVGHMGCAFSIIENNHIHHIGTKREFWGHEIGGIKLHAPIDVIIRNNRIDHCTLGTWLDWEAQGTRVTQNIYYANTRDLFVEVTHGPYLVDHNIFASPVALELFAQGGAFVNNLIMGTIRAGQEVDRATQYHRPHSTSVAGFATVVAGDDRFIGNLFIGGDEASAFGERGAWLNRALPRVGTSAYDGFPNGWEGYLNAIDKPGDHERFGNQRQGVYIWGNAYLGGAKPYEHEVVGSPGQTGLAVVSPDQEAWFLSEENDGVYLNIKSKSDTKAQDDKVWAERGMFGSVPVISGADLPRVRLVDAEFENPDGTQIVCDVDLVGAKKIPGKRYPAGPLALLDSNRIKVW